MVAMIQFTGQLWVPPLVCCGATAPTVENELWGALQSMALATIKPIKYSDRVCPRAALPAPIAR